MTTILVAGDFCPHGRITDLVEKRDSLSIFNDFFPLVKDADLPIVNLECPIASNIRKSISKIGPSLSTSENGIAVLKEAGFGLVTLANNHIMDYGKDGLKQTIETCRKYDIDFVGAGNLSNECSIPFRTEKNMVKISVINICENEFSTIDDGGYSANPLNIIKNHKQIRDEKQAGRRVIVVYHGGHEGYSYPSPRMKELFRFFVDAGADAVICHHAHAYSGFEIYKDAPVFYGLGNFIFDWPGIRNDKWNYGYAVTMRIPQVGKVQFELIPYQQGNEISGVCLAQGEDLDVFYSHIQELNSIIMNDSALTEKFIQLVKNKQKDYLKVFQPFENRIMSKLYRHGILPLFAGKGKLLRTLNLTRCEAHKDLFVESLFRYLD